MNITSAELGAVNHTLRIAIWCFSETFWHEPGPSGSGVAWHGRPAWDFADMQSTIGLRYEVVTELPEPEDDLYEDMLALMKGVADISIDYWGLTYERSRLVDFSYPESYFEVRIYSGITKGYVRSDLVMGVFDGTSYWLMISALGAMTLASWAFLSMEDRNNALSNSILYVFGNAFNQGLNDLIVPKSIFGRVLTTLFSMYNFVICLMYGSVIISILVGGTKPSVIDSLGDLNRTENMEMRIIIESKSHVTQFLTGTSLLSGFEHRIDLIDISELQSPATLEKILRRTHVMIIDYDTFYNNLCITNRDANRTIANLDEFRASEYSSRYKSM